jgi:hypothetical protein
MGSDFIGGRATSRAPPAESPGATRPAALAGLGAAAASKASATGQPNRIAWVALRGLIDRL